MSSQYLVDGAPSNNSKYSLGRYKVTAKALNVRSGAGTNYSVKRHIKWYCS